jgi:hypothetical protein
MEYPCVSCSVAEIKKLPGSNAPNKQQNGAGNGFTLKLTMVYYRPVYTTETCPPSTGLRAVYDYFPLKETYHFRNTQDIQDMSA